MLTINGSEYSIWWALILIIPWIVGIAVIIGVPLQELSRRLKKNYDDEYEDVDNWGKQ